MPICEKEVGALVISKQTKIIGTIVRIENRGFRAIKNLEDGKELSVHEFALTVLATKEEFQNPELFPQIIGTIIRIVKKQK